MAITIRNQETEAMIRKLGARHGEGPSATIRRLAAKALKNEPQEASPEEQLRRAQIFADFRRRYPPDPNGATFEEVMAEIDAVQSDLHD